MPPAGPPLSMLLSGDPAPPATPLILRAGPLSLEFLDGGLRYVTFEGVEVLRRIHGAVRDRNWGTVAGTCEVLDQVVEADRFTLTFERRHRAGDIAFDWRGAISGDADGTVRFTFDGVARSTFLRNRIGLVVLHPLTCAGARCRTRYTNGTSFETAFPDMVAAEQPVVALHDLRALAHEVLRGLWAEVEFEGDEFETEDQRNWIDASFKTYSTPLRVPFPLSIEGGTRVVQAVTLRLTAPPARGRTRGASQAATELQFDALAPMPLPSIGLGKASHGGRLRHEESALLRTLRPAHLRVDVALDSPGWKEELAGAAADAAELQAALELAVLATGDGAGLDTLLSETRTLGVPIAWWLLFDPGAKSTPASLLARGRAALGEMGAPVGGGTNADYYQLNQQRPDRSLMDLVAFSMTPQVHAFDAASLVETIAAIPPALRSSRHSFPGLPVIVSPVTLRPRFNPVATGDETAFGNGLPSEVDPRQLSLLGAAWTLGAVVSLAAGGAASVTFYETTGWRGVMERAGGSARPDLFPSVPGGVFPLYHVLADVAEFAGGTMQPLAPRDVCGRPVACGGVFSNRAGAAALVANLTGEEQRVRLPDGIFGLVRHLTVENALAAMRDPGEYRARGPRRETAGSIVLAAYEYVRIDVG